MFFKSYTRIAHLMPEGSKLGNFRKRFGVKPYVLVFLCFLLFHFRTWKVIGSKREYYINVCGNAKVKKKSCPSKAAVCSPSSADSTTLQDLGSKRQINATRDSGFDLIFTGGQCNEMGNNKAWETNIFMRCGKFLVSI